MTYNKRNIHYGLTLPLMCSFHNVLCLQRPHPLTTYMDLSQFQLHVNKGKRPKACLTNHKGSISHPVTPLVINRLGGGHAHTHTYSHCGQKQFQETSHTLARLVHTWLKNYKKLHTLLCTIKCHDMLGMPGYVRLSHNNLI